MLNSLQWYMKYVKYYGMVVEQVKKDVCGGYLVMNYYVQFWSAVI